MATLQYNFGNLWQIYMEFVGTYSTNTSAMLTTDIDEAQKKVNDAYLDFVSSNDWSFLKPEWQMTTIANQWEYILPDGFVKFITPRLYFSQADTYPPVDQTSMEEILNRRVVSQRTYYPEKYAIRAGPYDPKFGQRLEIAFDPVPDSSYTLNGQIAIIPVKLVDNADLPIGGPEYSGILKQMILAEAERNKDGKVGPEKGKADEMLTKAIMIDNQRNPRKLGKMWTIETIPIIGQRNCVHFWYTELDGTETDTLTSGY